MTPRPMAAGRPAPRYATLRGSTRTKLNLSKRGSSLSGPGARDDEVAHHRGDALGAQPTRDDDRVGAVRELDEEAAAAIRDRAA